VEANAATEQFPMFLYRSDEFGQMHISRVCDWVMSRMIRSKIIVIVNYSCNAAGRETDCTCYHIGFIDEEFP